MTAETQARPETQAPSEKLARIDIREKGRAEDGQPLFSDRRLFVQFLAYGNCGDTASLVQALESSRITGALYEDVQDPRGVGLATMTEDPDYFVTVVRQFLNQPPFSELTPKPEYAMLGRSYSLGYETDLDEALIGRPRRRIVDPALKWVVWYPLRRAGTFERLSSEEQRVILLEHGAIGKAFGEAGLGHDIRLACHGLDKNDNDFIIGLLGSELMPLSAIVQRMRKTRQTSLHIEHMGPFFAGKVVWQSK